MVWTWLKDNGWIVGVDGERRHLSVFEYFTWNKGTIFMVWLVAMSIVPSRLISGPMENKPLVMLCGFLAVFAVWWFALAAIGKGRPERSSRDVTRACVIAFAISAVLLSTVFLVTAFATY